MGNEALKSGTDTAAAETGAPLQVEHENEVQLSTAGSEGSTEDGNEEPGEEGQEPTEEEKKAAEEAQEREKKEREGRKGSPEWFQRKIAREADRRRAAEEKAEKAEKSAAEEREARIRAEEREKVLREVTGKSGEKTADTGLDPKDPRPKMPRMRDFDGEDDPMAAYEEAMEKFQPELARWTIRENSRLVEKEKQSASGKKGDESAKATPKVDDKFHERMDDIFDDVAEEYGEDAVKAILKDSASGKLIIPIGSPVQKLIFKSESAGKLLHHFHQNQEVLTKILAMDDEEQYTELRRLEKKVSTPPARTPGAPAPARPNLGGGSPKVDESKLSDGDWFQRRRKEKLGST